MAMPDPESSNLTIHVTAEVLAEAVALSEDILKDIELGQVRLSVVVLKAMRLARILNDFEIQQIFEWESSGYPQDPSGARLEVRDAATKAGRTYFGGDSTPETPKPHVYPESIEEIEHTAEIGRTSLQAAQYPHTSGVNTRERRHLQDQMRKASQALASRRTFIHSYVARKHYELKFAHLADDVFGRIRSSVDALIGHVVPDSVKKLTAVYDNLKSDNPEDWANAAHSCRRLLQDLAEVVFPAQDEIRTRTVNGKEIPIKLGADQYKNRLMAYIEDSSESSRFNEIVGSHLGYIGDRLDALSEAAQKGSHATVTKEEADRCVVYTYLLVGDILSLRSPQPLATETDSGRGNFSATVELHKRQE